MTTRTSSGAVTLFLAFALGYFFSTLLRAVIATLAPQFSTELGLSASDLGLLAGVFFAGFACTQLPLGAALDRLGPKRVLLCFMSVAVLACAAFARAQSFEGLLAARALMGVGVSAGLMAALTSFRHAYSPALQLRASSWMLMTGSLGTLMSTLPVHALVPLVGWRGLFWIAAGGLIACGILIAWVVPSDAAVLARTRPEHLPTSEPTSARGSMKAYRQIVSHPTFMSLLPLGLIHYGGLIAVQTLWAGPWLTRVVNLQASEAAGFLFLLNLSMLVSFASLGAVVPRLNRLGWGTFRLIAWVSPISAALLLAIALAGPAAGPYALVLWCVSCVPLSLSQPAVGQAFGADLVGRALSAYNLVIFLGVFVVQWGLGLLIDGLTAAGWAVPQAHQGALGLLACGCGLCGIWFIKSSAQARQSSRDDVAISP